MTQETVEVVVRDKASNELVSVAASATVLDAVDAMSRHDIGAVLIFTEDGLAGGIFTERDLLVRVVEAGRDPKTTPISLVMTRDVHFVSPGTPIDAALNLAAEVNAFRRELDGRDGELSRGIADLNRKLESLLAVHAAR